ncbi:hypothetical protein, partial [Sphingobium jiangsuense]|uniref:hypothetical protein n=1 Tax=Sphingobium jiangsuense TaxID=870476 RepID=UPI0024E0E5AE
GLRGGGAGAALSAAAAYLPKTLNSTSRTARPLGWRKASRIRLALTGRHCTGVTPLASGLPCGRARACQRPSIHASIR